MSVNRPSLVEQPRWYQGSGGRSSQEAVCLALLVLLAAAGVVYAQAPGSEIATEVPEASLISVVGQRFGQLWAAMDPILAATPNIFSELLKAGRAIGATSQAGLIVELAIGAVGIALALALAAIPRLLAVRYEKTMPDTDPFARIVLRFVADVGSAIALVVVAVLVGRLIFPAGTHAERLVAAFFELGVRYCLAAMIPAILLRPGEPHLRLVSVSEDVVRRTMPPLRAAMLIGLSFPALIPIWLRAGMDWKAAQALALIIGLLVAISGVVAALRFFSGRYQLVLRIGAVVFWLMWSYGVVALDFAFYNAVVATGVLLTVAFVAERFVWAGRRAARDAEQATDGRPKPFFWRYFGGAVHRLVYLLAVCGVLLIAVEWLGSIKPVWLGAARIDLVRTGMSDAVFSLLFGFAIFEGLGGWMRATFSRPTAAAVPGQDEEQVAPASRLSTIMPILHGFLAVAILGASVLVALARLGVDITPLLAGAGILGLAISFGSQSLVRDIVAGIFYMADDAFRLGEYIEAGRLKGTVERISLRSVRLRHQNGQIHTLPFGQLGSVTNYSRDWITMKFNLRLSRDVDIEVVRKIVKKVGHELLEHPELGREFIQPLKLQGVADILENALVLRFKFTVRPGKPTLVQRLALRKMVEVFAAKGIDFAANSVVVRNAEAGLDPAGAAAAMSLRPPVAV